MTPIMGIINPSRFLFYTSTQSNWPPLSAEKITLSLSHLVPEILGPKISFFTKMYYLTDFKHFVNIFSLIFNPIYPLFIDFRSFWPLIFTKHYIRLGPILFCVLNSATENLMKNPSPAWVDTYQMLQLWMLPNTVHHLRLLLRSSQFYI